MFPSRLSELPSNPGNLQLFIIPVLLDNPQHSRCYQPHSYSKSMKEEALEGFFFFRSFSMLWTGSSTVDAIDDCSLLMGVTVSHADGRYCLRNVFSIMIQ